MTTLQTYTRDAFMKCNCHFDLPPEEYYSYVSLSQSLQESATEKQNVGDNECGNIFELLARVTSMLLAPNSINEPFTPQVQNYQTGKRSALPNDFTCNELTFFEEILNDINEPRLQARIADVLWLCRKPRNIEHAITAITAYTQLPITSDSWFRDTNNCWERAARLSLQINDQENINKIKYELFTAFNTDFPDDSLMPFHLANLLDTLQIDKDYRKKLAKRLFQLGNKLKSNGDFRSARSYLELSSKKFKQCNDEQNHLDSLISIAESFEQEADSRITKSNMNANYFYNEAIQAYRCIPTKHRAKYAIENKLSALRTKITDTGRASLDEMTLLKTNSINGTDLVNISISFVTGKQSPKESLLYFSRLYQGPYLAG